MSRNFRLTRRAEASLVEIAEWTIATFGPKQADAYEAELFGRCLAIPNLKWVLLGATF